MILSERLLPFKQIVTQLAVFQIIPSLHANSNRFKQLKLDADPKAIQKISFTENPGRKCNKFFHY